MPEALVPGDVEQYTNGRLLQSDPETVRALNAALAKARRYCGWHVSPVQNEILTLDRPYSNTLILPTLRVVTLNSITVDGTAVDLTKVRMSREAPGVLGLNDSRPWGGKYPLSYDPGYGTMVVDLDHGYTAAEAEDFREAILRMIDVASIQVGTGFDGPLEEIKVDDVAYRTPRLGPDRLIDAIARNPMDTSVLYQYRILPL